MPMIPSSLRVVSWIQLVRGLIAAAGILVALVQGHLSLDFGVLGILIFFGLRKLRQGWRTCALVFLWLDMLAAVVVLVPGLTAHPTADFALLGVWLARVSPFGLCVLAILHFALAVWQYRVLTRPAIRSLFLGRAKRHAGRRSSGTLPARHPGAKGRSRSPEWMAPQAGDVLARGGPGHAGTRGDHQVGAPRLLRQPPRPARELGDPTQAAQPGKRRP